MQILEERERPGLATLYLAKFRGSDDHTAEFVDTLEPGVEKGAKWVMMISTQFGCAVGCRMCDAGALGYRGDLTAQEMLAQVRRIVENNPTLDVRRHPKVKIHFARMGEPSLNPAVLEALRLLPLEFPGGGLLASLSTVAPRRAYTAPFFEQLLAVKDACYPGGRFQLQFSLHSMDEKRRTEIVPIKKWRFDEIAAYGARFVKPGDRKITLNFALSPTDGLDDAAVARAFPAGQFLIKITPINPTRIAERNGIPSPWQALPAALGEAVARLRNRGFDVISSPSLPEEIDAATSCGQLWSGALARRADALLRGRAREKRAYVTADSLASKAPGWLDETRDYRRGGEPLRAEAAGLLVVDMQGLFLDPASPAYLPPARAVLASTRGLVEVFRRAGRPVYFSYHVAAGDGGLMASRWRTVCVEGTSAARVCATLAPQPERTFGKSRYNAFTNEALEPALRRDGVSQLVLAGVATHLCVGSTARDAFDRGLPTFVVADATAAHDERLHVSALRALAHGFSSIVSCEDVARALS